MKTSSTGRLLIEAFEGKFLHTYDDGTGVLTIGYGHTSAAGPPKVVAGMTITAEQCDSILAADLAAVEANVSKTITAPMTQAQFDALVSFDFNTGSLRKSSIDDKINAGNPTAAMATLLQYNHAGGKVMAGLTRRRQAERLLFLGQIDAAMKLAGVHAQSGDIMPQQATVAPVTPIATPATTPADHAKVGGTVVAATATAGAVAASQSGVSATEILLWIGGLTAVAIAAFIIGYRIIKGHWPWTSISTGNQSQGPLPLLPQSLAPSSEQVSAALSAVSSAASPATPSPASSASSPRRKRSAKPSQPTRRPRRKSSSSKPTAARKSAPKRKSKSKR